MKKLIQNTLRNSFFQGGILLTVSNFLVGFINYIFNILIARSFGPSGFGEISTFFSYVVILTIPSGIITNLIIIKLGGKSDPKAFTYSLIHWIQEKAKNWWYFITPVVLIIPFIPQLTNLNPIVGYAVIPFVLLIYISSLYDGMLQGLHIFTAFVVIGIAWALIRLIGGVIPLLGYQNLLIVLGFIYLATLVRIMWSHATLRKTFVQYNLKLVRIEKRLFEVWKDKQIWLTAISGASLILLSNIDIIYVKRMFTAEEAGIYNSWSLFAKVILYILGPILSLSFIFFSSKKNETSHKLFFIGIFLFLGISGLIAMIAYGLFGKEIIDLLFGKKFYPVIPYLEWASFFGIGYVLVTFMNNYYLAKGSNKAYILSFVLPIYILTLLIFGRDLAMVMLINIWFTAGVLTIYLLIYMKTLIKDLFS